MTKKKPEKILDLLAEVRQCIEDGRYLDSYHSSERRFQRAISRSEILHVLLNGKHEKSRDRFEVVYQEWSYSIRGKTIDGRDIRVIITFDENNLLIITAIDLS